MRALAKETLSFRESVTPIFDLLEKLITDYSFALFPIYTIPSTKRIKFSNHIDQVFDLEDDTEVEQFAKNCSAFASPAEDILEAAKKHKLFERFIHHVSPELQGMNPHLYAQNLSHLLGNKIISVADFKIYFKPSEEWKHEDYELLPLVLRPLTRPTPSSIIKFRGSIRPTQRGRESLHAVNLF